MSYFKLDLTKSQIELLLGLLAAEQRLKKSYNLCDISRIAKLDYQGCLYRNRDWLIEHKVLVAGKNGNWKIDYDAMAELMFGNSKLYLVYQFAYRHMEYSL